MARQKPNFLSAILPVLISLAHHHDGRGCERSGRPLCTTSFLSGDEPMRLWTFADGLTDTDHN
jgi:hypothetical protein